MRNEPKTALVRNTLSRRGTQNNPGVLETIQKLKVSELSVLALRIDLFHRGQALCEAQVRSERHFAIGAVFHAGVVEIRNRPSA